MALCGMDCIDLTEDVIKILGIYFSYKFLKMLKFKYFKVMETKKF